MTGGQKVGAVVGAAIGAFFGNPALGAQLGMMAGGYADPPDMGSTYGPRLEDLNSQTSTYGANIPRIYGKVATYGNMFWLKGNKIDEIVIKEKSGGSKGQPSVTSFTYYYQATFAVSICDNEIAGISRIWLNGQLYYDAASEEVNTIYSSGKNNIFFDVYTGTSTQDPCPEYEADVGVGNAPNYRGMSYIVFKDLPLARFGNSIPNVFVEVVESATYVQQQKLSDQVHYFDFSTVGSVDDGIPHIYRCNSGAVEISRLRVNPTLTDNEFVKFYFGIDGVAKYVDVRSSSDIIFKPKEWWYPNESVNNDVTIVGGLSDGSVLAVFTNADSGPERGKLNLGGDKWPIYTASYSGAYDWEPTDDLIEPYFISGLPSQDFIRIITVSTDGRYIFIATSPNYSGLDTYTYYVISSESKSVISSGTSSTTLNEESRGTNMLGNQDSSVISDDGKWLWGHFSNSAIMVYDLENSMQLHATFNKTTGISNPQSSIAETGGVCFLITISDFVVCTINDVITADRKSISEIISSETQLSNIITSSDIDVSGITDDCIGFRVAGINSIRKNIEPLMGAYSFDAIQDGYKVDFVPKNGSSVATIDVSEMIDVNGVTVKHDIKKDTDLPVKLSVNYLDLDRNYDLNEQYIDRRLSDAVNHVKYEMPIVLSADEAAQIAEKMLNYFWTERDEYSFTLNATRRNLQAGDVITITGYGRDRVVRLTETSYSGLSVECKAKGFNNRIYDSNAVGMAGPVEDTPVFTLDKSIVEIMDIPIVTFIGNEPGLHFAAFGFTTSWTGADVSYSTDNGYTYENLRNFGSADYATAGYVTSDYTTGKKHTLSIDRETVINVNLAAGQLFNVTEEQMLNGANYALWGVNGRWEVIKFQRAELQSDGTYNVYNLCRGRSGTEWATSLHKKYDKFIIYNKNETLFTGLDSTLIDEELIIKSITQGAGDETSSEETYTYTGVNLKPLSPVWATGSRDGSGNLTIGWTRRTRIGGKWKNGRDASLGEGVESYEIDIYSGSTVVRTLTSSTNSVSYTAAQQTTDFGSTQSVVACKIYQLSQTVGRGYELEANV